MADTLDWRGDKVKKNTLSHVESALVEFGLRCETAAKQELQPGHGVVTATLRRSIHIATPGYNWSGDNVEPSSGAPERGGQEAKPAENGGKMTIELGSGMEYSLLVHQGHGSFAGYHFITNAIDKMRPKFSGIIRRHAKQ